MKRIRLLLPALMLALIVVLATRSTAAAQNQSRTIAELKAAIDGPQRSASNKARDKYRHPLQTLTFFGVRPGMTLVEVWPGGGWYTEILAPFLKDHGKLYEAVGAGPGPRLSRLRSRPTRRSIAT